MINCEIFRVVSTFKDIETVLDRIQKALILYNGELTKTIHLFLIPVLFVSKTIQHFPRFTKLQICPVVKT